MLKEEPESPDNASGKTSIGGSGGNLGGSGNSMPHEAGGAGAGAAEGGMAGAHAGPTADFLWAVSGTRLKARFLAAEDGFEIPHDIYDSKLGVACLPTKFVDGVYRCLGDRHWNWRFSDPECTQRVAVPGSFDPRSTAAKVGDLAWNGDFGCDGADPETIFRLGEEVQLPGTLYDLSGTACVPSSWEPAATQKVYATASFDPTDLVSFSAAEVALSPRVAASVWVGDDGSRLPNVRQLRDRERDIAVTLVDTNTDAGWRLLPSASVTRIGCTANCDSSSGIGGGPPLATPFFLIDTPSCGEPLVDPGYVTFAPNWGWGDVQTFHVTPADTTIYVAGGGASPGGPMPASGLQADQAIPLQSWQEALPVETSGRFGLATYVRQVEGTVISDVAAFLQDKDFSSVTCRISRATDDELRCIPEGGASIVYVDEECNDPAASYHAAQGAGGFGGNGVVPPVPAFAVTADLDEPRAVYSLGAPTSSPQYFLRAYGECVPTTVDSSSAVRTVTEIPPETFGSFTIEIR